MDDDVGKFFRKNGSDAMTTRSSWKSSAGVTKKIFKNARTDFVFLPERLRGFVVAVAFLSDSGRKHQIRLHLAKTLNLPIVGDVKYGKDIVSPAHSFLLHCQSVSFVHPVTEQNVTITKDAPFIKDAVMLKNIRDVVQDTLMNI